MKHLEHSKWTAVKKIKNWRHYEVLNINKKEQKVEKVISIDSNQGIYIFKAKPI